MKALYALLISACCLSVLAQGRATIGIGSIEYRGMDSTENKFLGIQGDTAGFIDMVSTALVKTNKFNVVERDRVDAIVAEQSGIAQGTSAINYQFPGTDAVDYILLGAITEYGIKDSAAALGLVGGVGMSSTTARMAVDIRVLDVETGSIGFADTISAEIKASGGVAFQGMATGEEASEGEILGQVMRQCAQGVVNLMVSNIFPIRVVRVMQDGTAMLNYGSSVLAVGDVLNVYRLGEAFIDPDTGETLGQDEEHVGAIQVIETNARFSKAVSTQEGQTIPTDVIARVTDPMDSGANPQRKKKKRFGLF